MVLTVFVIRALVSYKMISYKAHRQVMSELKTDHPTMCKLITDLKVQKGAFHKHLVAENAPPKKQQRYI